MTNKLDIQRSYQDSAQCLALIPIQSSLHQKQTGNGCCPVSNEQRVLVQSLPHRLQCIAIVLSCSFPRSYTLLSFLSARNLASRMAHQGTLSLGIRKQKIKRNHPT